MINLVDEAGALSTEEFHELKNFVVDECLCTQVETPWLEYVKIRRMEIRATRAIGLLNGTKLGLTREM
ncbi:hypothetical protein [Methanosarcina barkeri]|uniref:hypothetical protein n=1 Tax=Methanosarcina barkeri TaxID=2208 RepID=UPI0006D14271|nr:hypothetical protein [Methanosarcina barkeri]